VSEVARELGITEDAICSAIAAATATASGCSLDPIELTLSERQLVIEQIKLILECHYVHLSLKQQNHGAAPMRRLAQLRNAIQQNPQMNETDFSRCVIEILRSMRDRHFDYVLPYARDNCVAYLPFLMTEIEEGGTFKYIVSASIDAEAPKDLSKGAEIVEWDGNPIKVAIDAHAADQPGCSPASRRSLAVSTLTMRLLQYDGQPQQKAITVTYLPKGSTTSKSVVLPWLVKDKSSLEFGKINKDKGISHPPALLATDVRLDLLNYLRTALFLPYFPDALPADYRQVQTEDDPSEERPWLSARYYPNANRPFGYIRILRFPKDATACWPVEQFSELLKRFQNEMPTHGLVIDIRSNPGGGIHLTDYLLQMFSQQPIQPPKLSLRCTQANLQLCSRASPDDKFQARQWVPSLQTGLAATPPEEFSEDLELARAEDCRNVPRKRVYFQSVVLITNALSYSASDFFAAGFQDHDLGPMLGVHPSTGGGGANVVNHQILGGLVGYAKLPKRAGLRFPLFRAKRRGRHDGKLLEDAGVTIEPANVHALTRKDVLNDDIDLIKKAAALIGL